MILGRLHTIQRHIVADPEASQRRAFFTFRAMRRALGHAGRNVSRISAVGIWSSSGVRTGQMRSEEHTSELQSRGHLVCRLLLEKKKKITTDKRRIRHTWE